MFFTILSYVPANYKEMIIIIIIIIGQRSPSILTGERPHPDMLLCIEDKYLYIIELKVGFETNLECNTERKETKYRPLLKYFENTCRNIKFINSSIISWYFWLSI